MYAEKIEKLENEIQEIKKYIKADKKEIKKREKILSMVVDNDIEVEIEMKNSLTLQRFMHIIEMMFSDIHEDTITEYLVLKEVPLI